MALINLPDISTGDVIGINTEYFVRMLKANVPCQDIRPMIFFGPTGVGKSTAVNQIALNLEEELGKKVEVVDIRLTSCTITDLIGIPSPNVDRTETVWLRPEIYRYDKETEDDTLFIYFFDELDKASPAVQAAALQLILDRKAWVHKFPKNTLVIAAANPARGTKHYETRMAPELLNRFRQFNVQPDFDSFRNWGLVNNVHPFILGYLAFDQSKLYAEKETDETAFPTPRSWKSVSDLLNAYEDCFDDVSQLHYEISSDIGTGAALEFEGWCRVYDSLPDVKSIMDGMTVDVPKSPDVIHALIASITDYIRREADNITTEELENAFDYVSSFPKDFLALFYKNVKDISELHVKLIKIMSSFTSIEVD